MTDWKKWVDYDIPNDVGTHMEDIDLWLKENILVYDNVKLLTLYDFQMDWQRYYGSFLVKFNAQVCPMKFFVGIGSEGNGTVSLQIPMFHSPLGAPCSYAAIDISDEVEATIKIALNSIFPSLRPLGLDRITGREITMRTPFEERIFDKNIYENVKRTVSKDGFQLTIDVESTCSKNICDIPHSMAVSDGKL